MKICGESSSYNLDTYFVSKTPYNPLTQTGDAAIYISGRPRSQSGTNFTVANWSNGLAAAVSPASIH